jgi:phage gpG-like protein
MANNAFIKKMQDIKAKIPQLHKRLPGIAKVEGLRFIADNFKHEGFEEKTGSYKSWKKNKDKNKKTLIGEKRGSSLKRSWQQESSATGTTAEFKSSLIYAEVHNEGLKAGRPPGFTMPQRQMIGNSSALNDRIEKKFDSEIDKIYR